MNSAGRRPALRGGAGLLPALSNLNQGVKSVQPTNISDTELLAFFVPVPPMNEQRAIANYLDGETAKIDQMVAKGEEALACLQEYRTALITAAVTGKIDVRKAKA